ncbi:MAG: hypothetical protein ACC660_00705 [Acidimicrobiales bacterium]
MTELGIAGGGPVVVLDPTGTLARLGGSTFVDWWIGADDRWHLASQEIAVRQGLVHDGSTVGTRLKIPRGDALQRVVVVPSRGTGVVLVEIENASPVPVAVAVALHVPAGEVTVAGDTVSVDGLSVLRSGRSVARLVVSDTIEAARLGVERGEALPPAEMEFPVTGSVVVAIFPLPHTAILQCVVAIEPVDLLAAPDDLPPVAAVARGWTSHLDAGAAITVPDDRLLQTVAAARRHLLVGSGLPTRAAFWSHDVSGWVPAVAAVALGAWGHTIAGRELLLGASGPENPDLHSRRGASESGALLWAWAERLERHPDPELEAAIVPWLEDLAGELIRRPGRFGRRSAGPGDAAWRAVGLAAVGSVMSRLGDQVLGRDIVEALPQLVQEIQHDPRDVALALGGNRLGNLDGRGLMGILSATEQDRPLASVVERSGPAGGFRQGTRTQHPELSALWLLAVRRSVVDEPHGSGGPLALLSAPDQSWLGGPVEAHNVPVTGGVVSFGVRWHGDRPALLWDVQTGSPTPGVCAPGLDSGWSDERAHGEALLNAMPGLLKVAGPESARVRRGETVDTTEEPDSFT